MEATVGCSPISNDICGRYTAPFHPLDSRASTARQALRPMGILHAIFEPFIKIPSPPSPKRIGGCLPLPRTEVPARGHWVPPHPPHSPTPFHLLSVRPRPREHRRRRARRFFLHFILPRRRRQEREGNLLSGSIKGRTWSRKKRPFLRCAPHVSWRRCWIRPRPLGNSAPPYHRCEECTVLRSRQRMDFPTCPPPHLWTLK